MQSTKTTIIPANDRTVPVPPAIRHLLLSMITNYPKPVAIDCWGQDLITGLNRNAMLTLHFRHPGVMRNLIIFRDRIFLTECWLNNYFEFDGSIDDMIEFAEYMSTYHVSNRNGLAVLAAALRLPSLSLAEVHRGGHHHSGSSASDIEHHYDVGNDYYGLFLDPHMVYSCAHFEQPNFTLAQAQEAKLDLICRKLRLQPGDHLLDVGCGWGALVRWAARNYGVTAVGITLSRAQLEYARSKNEETGLQKQVCIELMDYREIPQSWQFNKIVSVGMIEHVGLRQYPQYFSGLEPLLAPGGLFLCHGITTANESNTGNFNAKFVDKYIFPGGELANLPQLSEFARQAGWEVVDVDNWRPHYVKTLRSWAERLQGNVEQAIDLAGERITKLWLLYMTASARGFEHNFLRIYQVMLRRQQDEIWNLPVVRSGWLV